MFKVECVYIYVYLNKIIKNKAPVNTKLPFIYNEAHSQALQSQALSQIN